MLWKTLNNPKTVSYLFYVRNTFNVRYAISLKCALIKSNNNIKNENDFDFITTFSCKNKYK